MREISMHILDIVQNSISAKASLITVDVDIDTKDDYLTIRIMDNGSGMDEETVKRVVDPFYTSRTTRNVGLGIPMFKRTAIMCDGHFDISSKVGEGTTVDCGFKYSHIDRPPLGNMPETVMVMVNVEDKIDFVFNMIIDGNNYCLDTKVIREVLGEVPLNNVDVLYWIKENVKEGIAELKK